MSGAMMATANARPASGPSCRRSASSTANMVTCASCSLTSRWSRCTRTPNWRPRRAQRDHRNWIFGPLWLVDGRRVAERVTPPRHDQATGELVLPPGPGTSEALRFASRPGVARMSVSTRPASRSRFACAITGSGAAAEASPDSSRSCGNERRGPVCRSSLSAANDVLPDRAGVGPSLPIGRCDFEFRRKTAMIYFAG